MAALGTKLRIIEGGKIAFWCPGCAEAHAVVIEGIGAWIWNKNIETPSFSPSVLVTSGHYIPGRTSTSCWCTYNEENKDNPSGFICRCCHSFVTDGRIQYLSDCTHQLAGQTVDIPNWPE